MKRAVTETSQLLDRSNAGDETGIAGLIERHLPWIERHVRSRLGPYLRKKGETVDFVQDAMVEFLRYGPRVQIADDDHFRALLVRIIENTIRGRHDWFTAQRRKISRLNPIPSDTVLYLDPPRDSVQRPSEAASDEEEKAWIRLALELIDPEDREIIIRHQWEWVPFAEIGERLGISPHAARMRHSRAVVRLTRKVAELKDGDLAKALGS